MGHSFRNDYSEGAHEKIIQAIVKSNMEQTAGYGEDAYCKAAKEAIKKEIGREDATIYFLEGGTQTNQLMISSALRPHEAVIATTYGHINVHETGAVESTGHKVLAVYEKDGKLKPESIQAVLDFHTDHHMVKPKMVYVSNTTEIGTSYKKAELEALSNYCKEHNLYFFLDGARLGSALTSKTNDVTMKDIANLVDCFYIGGTKNGALFGEALVILNPALKEDLPYMIKQRGAMMAKGRLLGIQFLELFTDNLFYECGKQANDMSEKLKEGIQKLGYDFLSDSETNQQFPIFRNDQIEKIMQEYSCELQERVGNDYRCARFVTSWATKEEHVDELLAFLATL